MLVPPGVEVLVQDVTGTEEQSPSVELADLMQSMADAGVTVAAIVTVSQTHLILIGYRHVEIRNAESPPAVKPGGKRKL